MKERSGNLATVTAARAAITGSSPAAERLFAGEGEMRELCRAFDWASTPLGPVEEWSQSLRTTVFTVLASRNPMFLWWGTHLIQVYNDAYRPSLGEGGRHPRALGARGAEFWTDIWGEIGPQIAQVMNGGESTWHENQYLPIMRNGRLDDVWWTYSYSPVIDDDGTIGGTLVVCQETTQRVLADRERDRLLEETARAQQVLRESESRYRALFDSLDEGFCVVEILFNDANQPVDYRFLEANPAFEKQTGLVGAVGRTGLEMVPTLEQHWIDIYGKVAITGEPIRFEEGSDAMGRWFDVYAFRTGRPEEAHVALLFNDVSAARTAERERDRLLRDLRVEKARLADVFRQAPAFLAVLRGEEHVFELVNDAYYQLVGHRDIVGKRLVEALPEVREQGFIQLLDRVLQTGEPFVGREVQLHVARTPGAPPEERFVDLVYLPLTESDGTRAGIIAHGTDVTGQVRARQAVEQLLGESERARADAEAAWEEAAAANRAKSQFLAVMSHELRTPLNAIGGYAELIEMGLRGPVTRQQKEDLRRIQTSQLHLLGVINEVLNFARLETGTVAFELGDVPVGDALGEAEALVVPQIRAIGLTLEVVDCPADAMVRADAEKLRQILVNLLSNAAKFTEPGGRIELSCQEAGDQMAIRVRDTGIGIPADKLDAIFDPFTQVRADLTRTREGTGLGLAISRDLARGMGGNLTVESEIGVGSTFTITLPRTM